MDVKPRAHRPRVHEKALDRVAEPGEQFGRPFRVAGVVAGRRVGRNLNELAQKCHLLREGGVDEGRDLRLLEGHRLQPCAAQRASSRRTVSSIASKPASASSAVICSAGLWLMPSLQRTKIMPDGQCLAMMPASWPAPEGSRSGSKPQAAMASATVSTTPSSSRIAGFSW